MFISKLQRSLKYTVLVVPFLVAACGEGYEPVRTNKVFPYGNARTAGSVIAYVQAKMMPEKELKLEPVIKKVEEPKKVEAKPVVPAPPQAEIRPEPPPVEQEPEKMDKIFKGVQEK